MERLSVYLHRLLFACDCLLATGLPSFASFPSVRASTYGRGAVLAAFLVVALSSNAADAADVTWADFISTTPAAGVTTTVSLGGGTTVDITVNTGGAQGLFGDDLGTIGVPETGLEYTNLFRLRVFNGGGIGTVPTVLEFTNFSPGPGHIRGFIAVSGLATASAPITATSSVPGAVQSWSQAGTWFDLGQGINYEVTWDAVTGRFDTSAPLGVDSGGIVVDIGSLSQYGTITLSLDQDLDDGVFFSIGEESPTTVPTASGWALAVLGILLVVVVITATRWSTDQSRTRA